MATDQKTKRPAKKNEHPHRKKMNEVKAAEIAARQIKALDLRIAGGSYRKIGEQLSISYNQAMLDVKAALDALQSDVLDKADRLRSVELHRLDVMTVHAMNVMTTKDMPSEIRLKAIDRLVKITGERAKLLGLYMPYKVEHSGAVDFTTFLQELEGED